MFIKIFFCVRDDKTVELSIKILGDCETLL
jgi:hypothetical protein